MIEQTLDIATKSGAMETATSPHEGRRDEARTTAALGTRAMHQGRPVDESPHVPQLRPSPPSSRRGYYGDTPRVGSLAGRPICLSTALTTEGVSVLLAAGARRSVRAAIAALRAAS
jgi:hypothetical protein